MRTTKNLNYIGCIKNQRFLLIDAIWKFQYMGNATYSTKVYDNVYTKDGISVGEREIISKVEEVKNQIFVKDDYHCLIQFNLDFHLIPRCGGDTIPEIQQVINILNDSFKGEFNCEYEGQPLQFDYCHRKEYRDDYWRYGMDKDNSSYSEICSLGHSRLIYNILPEKPDYKRYKKNYLKALKKYPEYVDRIEWLFNCNKPFFTKSKSKKKEIYF